MAIRPLTPCKRPACPATTRNADGYCDQCGDYAEQKKREQRTAFDKGRGTYRQRGYGARWDKLSAWYKRQEPMCQKCNRAQVQIVHHVVPVSVDPAMLMLVANLQSLCARCHKEVHADLDRCSKGRGGSNL